MGHVTVRRLVVAAAAVAVALTGCSTGSAGGDVAEAAGAAAPTAALEPGSDEAGELLTRYGLAGMGTVEIIDHLDRLGRAERPAELMASVRPDELLVASGEGEVALPVPDDQFYLSVAPYVDHTHECFYHSLTTCTGELASEDVQVQIVDEADGTVLVDETRTTFENGFVGFWLPTGIDGTLRITHDGKVGEVDFATDDDAPTCLTTLQLA